MAHTILLTETPDSDVESEPLTYLEEHHPGFVAELLELAARLGDERSC